MLRQALLSPWGPDPSKVDVFGGLMSDTVFDWFWVQKELAKWRAKRKKSDKMTCMSRGIAFASVLVGLLRARTLQKCAGVYTGARFPRKSHVRILVGLGWQKACKNHQQTVYLVIQSLLKK